MGGSGYVKTQSGFALCDALLNHILPPWSCYAISYTGWQKISYLERYVPFGLVMYKK
jgi:hypothetical protein